MVGNLIGGSQQSSAISSGQSQANANLSPFTATGTSANAQEANLAGLNGQTAATNAMGTFQSSPGYGYQVQQGLAAVDQGAASQGMLRSGATLKAEQTLGNNLANQNYSQYLGQLNTLAGQGLSAATGQANVATGAAGQQASIAGNTTGNITNALSGTLGNTGVQNSLSSMYNGTSGGGSGNFDYVP